MKNFCKLGLIGSSLFLLSACSLTAYDTGFQTKYLEGDRGNVTDCPTKFSESDSIPKANANAFWKNNNLPKGTLDFVCKDGKAYLPKGCQGNSLNRQQILSYWNRYQLPKGLVNFDCSTGTPKIPANELDKWKNLERQNPTCKGGKPCVF